MTARACAAALALLVALSGQAAAQDLPRLGPGAADRLLSRLTDAELRAFLAEELAGPERAPAAAGAPSRGAERLAMRGEAILAKLGWWIDAMRAVPQRGPEVRARLAEAPHGVSGMLAATVVVGLAGIGAAVALLRAAAPLRRALSAAPPAGLGGRVWRGAARAAIEAAAVAAFVFATLTAATPLRAWLGPMWDYVWIWHAGISGAWTVLLLGRALLAPDAPAYRVAALDDADAGALWRRLRAGVAVGAAGWLVAGMSPTLGVGFGPAILIVFGSVTGVAVWTLAAVWRARVELAARARRALCRAFPAAPLTLSARAGAAAPALLASYVAAAGGWWALHWLETGVQRLEGPLGTAALALAAPALDARAAALAARLSAGREGGARLAAALRTAARALLGAALLAATAALWGLDLAAAIGGPQAPAWLGTAVDLIVTLAVVALLWRVVVAAVPEAPPGAAASDGDEGGEVSPEARRATLAPLLRGFLKGLLVTAGAFSALSSLGVDVGPLIASAGVVGIAVGFGAQTLVRDVFSGLFFLAEDAFRLGEYVEFDSAQKGTVEAISLRSLRLRHHLGGVITVPFGELRSVTNHSRDWVIFRLDLRMEPETDPAEVKRIVKGVGAELLEDPEHGAKLLEPPKSQGVFMIDDDSALVIRIKFKSRPGAQWILRRELYHRLTRAFAGSGLRLARRKVEVVSSSGAPEAAAAAQ